MATLWQKLILAGDAVIGKEHTDSWHEYALCLMAIADESSLGIGFTSSSNPFPLLVKYCHKRLAEKKMVSEYLPYLPVSLCMMVPPNEACVQPKTITPQVGCTLRSLSHNLALLPAYNIVSTSWLPSIGDGTASKSSPLNLLLIPFPYHISGIAFDPQEQIRVGTSATDTDTKHHFFGVNQEWLKNGDEQISADCLVEKLIEPLLNIARKEVGNIHGIVFPELALTDDHAQKIAERLAKHSTQDLEFFVTGVSLNEETNNNLSRNCATSFVFSGGKVLAYFLQSKHHRWCLEQTQIQRYHLGHALQPNKSMWWEKIDVSNRTCVFTIIRKGTTLAVMICEDLARFDPVHPAVRAVGPNLVIALLMDGPQLKGRWPGRYATVLADDPGCGVLTFTCLGMVRRSVMPGADQQKAIALWKQPDGDAQELNLPIGDQALVLTLSMHCVEQFTLDGRSDGGATRRFELSGVRGVRLSKDDAEKLTETGIKI